MDSMFFAAINEFQNELKSSDSELLDMINAGTCRMYHIRNLKLQNLAYLFGMMQAFTILDYSSAYARSKFYTVGYNMYEDSLRNMYHILSQKVGD